MERTIRSPSFSSLTPIGERVLHETRKSLRRFVAVAKRHLIDWNEQVQGPGDAC